MSAREHQLNPSDLSNDQLDRIAIALYPRLEKLFEDRPMSGKEACAWMGISRSTFYGYIRSGKIKAHRLTKESDAFYLKSEILEAIKRS